MQSILSRYIFKELIFPFFLTLIFLTFIFLMTRIPEITNMVVNYNTGLTSVFMLIIYTIPRFMEFTIPMSVMISVLLVIMRMSNDNEITALKSSGISIYRLIPPILLFCIIGTLISLWITLWSIPWGRFSFAVKGVELAKAAINVSLKERQFNSIFNNVMIYITSIDIKTAELSDIFIEDSRNPNIVNITTASKGRLISYESETEYNHTLRLSKGIINQVDIAGHSVNTVSFDSYDINFDTPITKTNFGKHNKEFYEMYFSELRDFIKKAESDLKLNSSNSGQLKIDKKILNSALMEFHEKFSISFVSIILGLLAVPVGIASSSARRSSSFGLALSFFLFYYILLSAAWSAGESGYCPPAVGMWFPNIIMSAIAIYMFLRVAQEKVLSLSILSKFTFLNSKLPFSFNKLTR